MTLQITQVHDAAYLSDGRVLFRCDCGDITDVYCEILPGHRNAPNNKRLQRHQTGTRVTNGPVDVNVGRNGFSWSGWAHIAPGSNLVFQQSQSLGFTYTFWPLA